MDKAQLEALLERVEKATGPDRELDFLIEAEMENREIRFVDHPEFGRQMLAKHRHAPFDECWMDHPAAVSKGYTASIDASKALVSRKFSNWQLNIHDYGMFSEASIGSWISEPRSEAPTAPLAIIKAMLKALIAQEAACAS
jgi:hypothetical protein